MANKYPANLGDVLKHLLLCEALEAVSPTRYIESHGGALQYPLAGVETGAAGVWDFVQMATPPNTAIAECAYTRVIGAVVGTPEAPGEYPGSIAYADALLPPDRAIVVAELETDSGDQLRRQLEAVGRPHEVVIGRDGLELAIDVAEAGDLVLIDPFSVHNQLAAGSPTSLDAFEHLASRGVMTLLWYPLTRPHTRLTWPQDVRDKLGLDLWRAEVRSPGGSAGLAGCGLIAANLPAEVRIRMSWLAQAFGAALGVAYPRHSFGVADAMNGVDPHRLWNPFGADRPTPDAVRAAVARVGFPLVIVDADGDWLTDPIAPSSCSVHEDETDGTVRVVLSNGSDRPTTVRVGRLTEAGITDDDGTNWSIERAPAGMNP